MNEKVNRRFYARCLIGTSRRNRAERVAIARPRRHELPPLLKQVGAAIGALDRAPDGVGQGLFGHLTWKARVLFGPRPEG